MGRWDLEDTMELSTGSMVNIVNEQDGLQETKKEQIYSDIQKDVNSKNKKKLTSKMY